MITAINLSLLTACAVGVLMLIVVYQSRKNKRLTQDNNQLKTQAKQQKKAIQNVKKSQQIRKNNATANRDELDYRLSERGYYRD